VRRICIVIGSLAPGGAEKQSVLLAKALTGTHELHFVVARRTPSHTAHLRVLEQAGVEPTFLGGGPLRRLFVLAALLRSRRIEVLFSFLPGDTTLSALAGRMAGVPCMLGGIRNSALPLHKRWVLRFVHNRILTGSISNSHAGKREFTRLGFDAAKLRVVPNGIEVGRPSSGRSERDPVEILTVGRFVAQKDYRTALRSIALLRDQRTAGPRIHYSIAGVGPLESEIRAWIGELGLRADVCLQVDPEDLVALYERADVVLSTSRFEGLSNVMLEAMVHSLPIVATDVGDNRQLVQDGVNGFLAPVGDVRALAGRLGRLVDSYAERRRMGRAGRRIAEEGYGFEAFRTRYLGVVDGFGVGEEPLGAPSGVGR
jgi:glycosyltransferase involved in cell wall biosynthesis